MSLILYTDYVNTPQSESIILMQIRSKGVNSIQSSAMPISDINLSYGSPIKCFGKFTSHCPFPLNYQCYFGCDALIFLIWILPHVYMSVYLCIITMSLSMLYINILTVMLSVVFVSWAKWINTTVYLTIKLLILRIWNCYTEAIASFAILGLCPPSC